MYGLAVIVLFLILMFVFREQSDEYLIPLLLEKDFPFTAYENEKEVTSKRLKKAKLVFILLLVLPFKNYSLSYLCIIFFLFLFVYKLEYVKRKKGEKKKLKQLQFQFPIWLRQLQILLQCNNVIHALRLSRETAPILIQEDLDQLISEVEKDAIQFQPYINFLSQYHLPEIERAMKLLYRYQMVGQQDTYLQFQRMIQTTTKWLRNERETRNDEKMMIYQWWGILPLIGVTVLFMCIMSEILMNLFGKGVA